jgi:tetratricopeptide (TPR) repeat protein
MDPLEALGLLIQQFGLPGPVPPGTGARVQMYRSLLAGKQVLIVLDNAATAGQVRPLLPGSGRCAALVTSRSDLSGLVAKDGARRVDMDLLPLDEAVALLRRIIGDGRVDADLAAAAEVARLCCRLPLALRIAAERAVARPAVGLRELASQLAAEQDRLEILATPDGDPATATRTVFSWSYRKLTAEAQRGFRLLGLASGPDISTPAAAALCGVPAKQMHRTLHELTSEHLLEESQPGRYRCHDLLRRYAAECAETGEADRRRAEAVARLLTWYLIGADAADRVLLPRSLHVPREAAEQSPGPVPGFSGHSQALAWCDMERANLMAAIRQASAAGLHAIAWKLPAALWGFFYLRKPWADWIAGYETGLASARQVCDAYGEAWMLYGLGTAHNTLGQHRAAIGYYEQSLTVWRAISHQWGEAMTLNNMSVAYCGLSQFETALGIFRQTLRIRQEIGDERGQAQSMINIGEAYSDLGDYPQALTQLQDALRFCQQIGYPFGKSVAMHNLGAAHAALEQDAAAIEHLQDALRLSCEVGDEQGQAETLDLLSQVQHRTGAISDARISGRQSLKIFEALGDPQAARVRARLDAWG